MYDEDDADATPGAGGAAVGRSGTPAFPASGTRAATEYGLCPRTRARLGRPRPAPPPFRRRSLCRLRRRRSRAGSGGAGSRAAVPHAARSRYAAYFRYLATSPADEIALARDVRVPLIRTTPITLPFDLSDTVADNCLSLSGLGYHLGIGGHCPSCAILGEPRLGAADRASLVLAYVQLLNNIYEYRAFLASVSAAAASRPGTDAGSTATEAEAAAVGGFGPDGGGENPASLAGGAGGLEPGLGVADRTERRLTAILAQPGLFFAYHVLRDAGLRDVRVLFYPDPATPGRMMMYVVFPGKAIHVHYRALDHLRSACPGYTIVAHVWQTMFFLAVRKTAGARIPEGDTPSISASDLYCKMSDLNFDGELLLEYRRLYTAFDGFLPPP